MTFDHCPRCLSSSFPKLQAPNLLVGCAFCAGKPVQLHRFNKSVIGTESMAGLCNVIITPPPEQPQQDAAP